MNWHKSSRADVLARDGGRKYLNTNERRRFLESTCLAAPKVRLFCSTLMWSGARISEVLALTPAAIDVDECVATLRTLKRRVPSMRRQVPLPPTLVRDLDYVFHLCAAQRDPIRCKERLWSWSRSTAWRRVKEVMRAADISGAAAMPKGLRHTFGVAAFQGYVPPHIVQRWLGHASLETTAIYADLAGPEEREIASRIWDEW